jgi:hypothetical protein
LLNQNEILPSPVVDESEALTKRVLRRSDHELQLARRIDWRFLLPEPYLRRVAYFGQEPGMLPSALEHFSESLRINSVAENGSFDLVVLHLIETSSLAKAHKLLAPGGFLYWEMKPLNWAASWRGITKRSLRPLWAAVNAKTNDLATGPHKPRFFTETTKGSRGKGAGLQKNVLNLFHDHVAALERLGFGDIQMHWQRPNFEACLEVIPMNAAALDYAFSRPRSDWASRLKFAAGRVMMQTGLLAHLTPCFSLIARRS